MSWEKVKLSDLCKMNSGGTPSRSKLSFYQGHIPWAKISDIENAKGGLVFDTEEHITNEGLADINNRIFSKGILLLAMYGSVGKIAFTGVEMSTNQAILGINIKDENHLNYSYLKYWFQTIKEQLLNRAVGGTLQNISLGIVKELQIPLPALPIQKRIAAILDAADALKRKDQELLKKYDELAQAIFIELFGDPVKNEKGWEVKTIDDVCFYVKDGPHVSPNYTKEGIPFISVNNIIKGTIDLSNCKYISQEDFEIYSKKGKPEIGDILYTKGGTTGFAKRVDLDIDFVQWVHVALLKFDNEILNPVFFEYMLNSAYCYHQSQLLTKGIANRDLVLGEIKKITILLPPKRIQQEFQTKISLVEKLKVDLQKIKRNSDNLFNSLLQKAFNGELVS